MHSNHPAQTQSSNASPLKHPLGSTVAPSDGLQPPSRGESCWPPYLRLPNDHVKFPKGNQRKESGYQSYPIPLNGLRQLKDARIARLKTPHSGGKGQWGPRPFATRVGSGTGPAASFQSTGHWQVLRLLNLCTQIPTKRLSR